MNAFVVPFKIMVPDRTSRRQHKSGCFIRHSRSGVARNDRPKSDSVIEGAYFHYVASAAFGMGKIKLRAITLINRFAVNAAPGVSLAYPVRFYFANFNAIAEVDVIYDDAQQRILNHWFVLKRNLITQLCRIAKKKLKLHIAIWAMNLDAI